MYSRWYNFTTILRRGNVERTVEISIETYEGIKNAYYYWNEAIDKYRNDGWCLVSNFCAN